MENLALTTLMLPFIGALVVSFSPQRRAAEWGFCSPHGPRCACCR
ncbi:hydantoin racemase [Escherichia coli]|nr:hydantoin racemase [Escherichia coli]